MSALVTKLRGRPIEEILTTNRREDALAIDDLTAAIPRVQIEEVERRADLAQVDLVENPYVFTDAVDGSVPWKPDTVSQYFSRRRGRIGLDHPDFSDLRKFVGDLPPGDGRQRHPGHGE